LYRPVVPFLIPKIL